MRLLTPWAPTTACRYSDRRTRTAGARVGRLAAREQKLTFPLFPDHAPTWFRRWAPRPRLPGSSRASVRRWMPSSPGSRSSSPPRSPTCCEPPPTPSPPPPGISSGYRRNSRRNSQHVNHLFVDHAKDKSHQSHPTATHMNHPRRPGPPLDPRQPVFNPHLTAQGNIITLCT